MNDYILITGDEIQLGDLMPVEGNRWGIVTAIAPLMVFGRYAQKVTIETAEGDEHAQVGDAEQIRVRRAAPPADTADGAPL